MAKGKMGFEKGNYGSAKGVRAKAVNLSDAQLKRAGALKASKKAPTDISKTSRATEGVNKGKTLGPANKPLTGSVKLANGKTAVYKAGKRVINVKSSDGSGGNPPPPPPKTLPLDMRRNAPGTRSDVKASASRIAAYNTAKSKTMDVNAKRVAAKRRPAAGRSTLSTPSTSYADRPSFVKQKAAVAQALIDFRNATTEATKASAKRKYDQHVAVLNNIRDYFRS